VEGNRRFVSYAFCVGDVFIELDRNRRVVHADGALGWLGMDDRHGSKGYLLSALVDADDYKLLTSSMELLHGKQRMGPIPVHMGANPKLRRLVALFLSLLPGDKTVNIVAVAMSRLGSIGAKTDQILPDGEAFLNQLPSILAEQSGANDVLISLLQIANQDGPKDYDFFARQLAALSLGGQAAADFGGGRFAVVHEKGDGGDGGLMGQLARLTGETFDSATLESGPGGAASGDTARALVYSVRKFADTRTDIDLKALSENFSKDIDELRERIANLRRLLKERRFHAAYQPIVSLATGDIHHVEALVRFDTRSGSPFELITFAEEVGMIGEFDMMMLATVTSTLTHWADKNGLPRIAVNLSARSLTASDVLESIMQHLRRHKGLAENLMIEVTESAQVTDLSRLSDAARAIREAGFKVCLDDFGAGASGFQYLKNIKVDYVKIDGVYVKGAENDAELRAFLHAMATLCSGLGIKTIAEHVETETQAELLRGLGVDYAQGFYFGHPLVNLSNAVRPVRDKKGPTARAAAS
jgi:EAL domain-containing protein (putative c-di-GMP-specific phosphodiesterase class I)